MKRLIIFILCCLSISTIDAKQKAVYDSSNIQVRQISSEDIHSYKNDSDFDYEKLIPKEKSLWDRFWEWVWKNYEDLMHTQYGPLTRDILFIVIGISVILFIIYQILKGNTNNIFQKTKNEKNIFSIETEDPHQINFDEAIRDALKKGDFNLCIRLLYLQSLKLLSDKNLINFKINKTNAAYILELTNHDVQKPFETLTRYFEQVYYGNMQSNQNDFDAMQEKFTKLTTQL